MRAFKNAIGAEFFEKFTMHLQVTLNGQDFDHSFSCRWSQIEEALSKAQREDGQAKCLSAFPIEESTILGGKSIESTLYKIEAVINKTFNQKDTIISSVISNPASKIIQTDTSSLILRKHPRFSAIQKAW